MSIEKFNIVVLASGAGSTLDFLLDSLKPADKSKIVCLITDNPKAGAIEVAKKHLLKYLVIPMRSDQSRGIELWDQEVVIEIRKLNPDAILLAGFLKKIGHCVLNEFRGRVFNTHPSLLPLYGGKGMYGTKIHQKVLLDGRHETGVTIHEVNEEYDKGRILKQIKIKIESGEKVEILENKVKKIEKELVLEFLKEIDFYLQRT